MLNLVIYLLYSGNSIQLRALANFSIYAFGSALQTATGFLLLPVYINYLTTAEYGMIAVVLSLSSILAVFANLGSASGFFRLYFEESEEELFTTTLLWQLLTASGILIILYLFSKRVSVFLFKEESYQLAIILAGLSVLVSPLKELLFLTFRLKQQAKRFVAYSVLHVVVDFALKLTYVGFLKKGVNGFWVAQVLGNLISAIIIFWHAKMIRMVKKPGLSLMKKILKVGSPYTLSTLGEWVSKSSDRLFLNAFVGPSTVGVYALATKISSLFGVILNRPVGLCWGPFILDRANKQGIEAFKETNKKFLNVLSIVGPIAISIINLLALVIAILPGNPEYKNAMFLVPFCLIPLFIRLMEYPFAVQFLQAKITHYAGWGGLSIAVVNLGINILLIPMIGVWGAIISGVVSYSSCCIIYYVGGQRSLHIHYKWKIAGKNLSILLVFEATLISVVLFKWIPYIPFLISSSIVTLLSLALLNHGFLVSAVLDIKSAIFNRSQNAKI